MWRNPVYGGGGGGVLRMCQVDEARTAQRCQISRRVLGFWGDIYVGVEFVWSFGYGLCRYVGSLFYFLFWMNEGCLCWILFWLFVTVRDWFCLSCSCNSLLESKDHYIVLSLILLLIFSGNRFCSHLFLVISRFLSLSLTSSLVHEITH